MESHSRPTRGDKGYALLRWLALLPLLLLNPAWGAQGGTAPLPRAFDDSVQPMDLGVPAGCTDSHGYTLNNGAYPSALVLGTFNYCEAGGAHYPYTWRNGIWQAVPLPSDLGILDGYVLSVSDDHPIEPTLTLGVDVTDPYPHREARIKMAGQAAAELPLLAGMMYSEQMFLSALGLHVVGSNLDPDTATSRAVHWTREGAGWSAATDIGPGTAMAVSDDGRVVGGVGGARAWVWEASGGGQLVLLEDRAQVNGITHDGSLLVGGRNSSCKYPCSPWSPVYWVRQNGQWRMQDLTPLEGGLNSEALSVAIVGGQPVIVGYGWSPGPYVDVPRPVVWIPDAAGSYGAPQTLPALGQDPDTGREAYKINRDGVVVGYSHPSPDDWTPHAVLWFPFGMPTPEPALNAGYSGAWFNPQTAGQGMLMDVEPADRFIFLAWFAYTDAAAANPFEHHWFTAQGTYSGTGASLPIHETLGGRFDDPQTVSTETVGQLELTFSDCSHAEAAYSLDHWALQGSFALERVIPGSQGTCEQLAGSGAQAVDLNVGMDGAWYDTATPGQGFLLDVDPDPQGGNFLFLAWFTYDDATASGQHWLTAQGGFTGSSATLDVHETTGGSFDASRPVTTVPVGSMSIEFSDCSHATLNYDLAAYGKSGTIDITRLLPKGSARCEELTPAR